MSAIYNNIYTMRDEDLDRQRKNDRIDPAIRHAFDIEYRIRQLEHAANEQYTGVEADKEIQLHPGAMTIHTPSEEEQEPEEEKIPETLDHIPDEVTKVLRHFNQGHIIEDTDGFYAVNGEEVQVDGVPTDQLITPMFNTEQEVWAWIKEHVNTYMEMNAEEFNVFWEVPNEEGEE